MRRRVGYAIALGVLVGLGGTGCATSRPRPEAPVQFRDWKPTEGPKTASVAKPAPAPTATPNANRPSFPWAEPTGPSKPSTSGLSSRPWRYKPGMFFRRLRPAEPASATPTAGPDGALARFFPSLYGQNYGDPARLAQARRPARTPMILGGAIETTRGTLAARDSSSGEGTPLLPVALEIRAHPKVPSPGLPEPGRVALRGDEPVEHRTSHEAEASPESKAPREPDLIDGLTTELGVDPPAATGRPGAAPSGPSDRPASANSEIPAGALRLADRGPASRDEENVPDLQVEPLPRVAATLARPPVASHSPVPTRPIDDPALAGRPRMLRAQPMELPPAEFPATYHTESLRMVLKERPMGPVGLDEPARAEPRRPIFPRLARLWQPSGVEDGAVIPTSARFEIPGPARGFSPEKRGERRSQSPESR